MSSVPKLFSAELTGIDSELIEVEADINVGLHAFNIVGLADKAVSEAKERVNSALKNSGIKPPTKENRRITVNLAPADVKKAGSRFDLPIALVYLLASDQMKVFNPKDKIFVGELSLDGELRPVNGCLSIALLAKAQGIKKIFLPAFNAREAAVVNEVEIFPVKNIKDIIQHLEGTKTITPEEKKEINFDYPPGVVTLGEIKGQNSAKRALSISAAGGHHLFMTGPPGTGKTMLAQSITSILPPLNLEECMEITKIYSSVGLNKNHEIINYRPFRSPHHSSSLSALLGGGTIPRPGEISLAHRGVLFLDEAPEFNRNVIESLRQPLESGSINVARAKKSITFPARFILTVAQNPCPCGYFDDPDNDCKCTASEINRYQKKLSGPLMDRIDIQIEVQRIPIEELRSSVKDGRINESFREKVEKARQTQEERFRDIEKVRLNSEMKSKDTDKLVNLSEKANGFITKTLDKKFVSARGYYRLLKVSRTIADMEGSEKVEENHIAEAFQYRLKKENNSF